VAGTEGLSHERNPVVAVGEPVEHCWVELHAVPRSNSSRLELPVPEAFPGREPLPGRIAGRDEYRARPRGGDLAAAAAGDGDHVDRPFRGALAVGPVPRRHDDFARGGDLREITERNGRIYQRLEPTVYVVRLHGTNLDVPIDDRPVERARRPRSKGRCDKPNQDQVRRRRAHGTRLRNRLCLRPGSIVFGLRTQTESSSVVICVANRIVGAFGAAKRMQSRDRFAAGRAGPSLSLFVSLVRCRRGAPRVPHTGRYMRVRQTGGVRVGRRT
jgi:hypothetical protein